MILTVKKAALIIAVSTGLCACDSLQITGGPLNVGAAQAGNLLDSGGFERGFGNWRACSDPQLVSLENNEERTEGAAIIEAGGCLYQTVSAQPNDTMTVTCNISKATHTNWASVTFGYLDADYQPLDTVEAEIPNTTISAVSATLRAPAHTAYAEVLVYAQDGAEIEDCELTAQQGTTLEILVNNNFDEGLEGWTACAQGSATAASAMATVSNSCISQKFTASEGLELLFTCDGHKTGDEHAAVILGYLDADFQGIEVSETQISELEGLNPSVTLTAPSGTKYVEAMVYAEGQADLNSCSLKTPAATE